FSCCPPFETEAEQVRHKLNHQAKTHQDTGEIGGEPARVMDHLQDRAIVILIKTRLVKGFAGVTQRVVHVNLNLTVIAAGRLELDPARKVLGGIGSGVDVVSELEQFQGEGLVKTARAHFELIGAALIGKIL